MACSHPLKLLSASLVAAILSILANVPSQAQGPHDLEAKKTAAYQRFHRGEVAEAAQDIRGLTNEVTDVPAKTLMLRDLVEICWTGLDVQCTIQAAVEALESANATPNLKYLVPELLSYLVAAEYWRGNNDEIDKFVKGGAGRAFANPLNNPVASANINLALHAYFIQKNDRLSAEEAYSSALLSLLMFDPKNKYGISKILVELLEALAKAQDIIGAKSLVSVANQYLEANLNHQGPYYARYALLVAQLFAFTNAHAAAALALPEASRLNERLHINEDVRTYRLASNNSLLSLALILDGRLQQAQEAHEKNPLQGKRQEILARGEFSSYQEMYFALSDTIVRSFSQQKSFSEWRPLFEKPLKWKISTLVDQEAESYRNFGLALSLATEDKDRARTLYRASALQRIDNFEATLKARFEGFQLPSSIDLFIIGFALSSATRDTSITDLDLILKGSQVLNRTIRDRLSDFAILIGAQVTDEGRNKVRSYELLTQQKRAWELERISDLLAEKPIDRGSAIHVYTELVGHASRLKSSFASDSEYVETAGYPSVAQVKQALQPDEAFVSYFPTIEGLGRLCITSETAMAVVSPYSPTVHADIKLLRLALTADHLPDPNVDSQFPVDASIRMHGVLFEGLRECIRPGMHINIALPDEMAGIPIGVLLERAPKQLNDGYDLATAEWFADKYSYAIAVSARHFIGVKRSISLKPAPREYLGIGNPLLPTARTALATGERPALSSLPSLPETAQEVASAARIIGGRGSDQLLGKLATEEAFRTRPLAAYDVLHFATHGLLKDELAGLSDPALVLTPSDQSDSLDDGLLSAREISRFTLNARLIVLSACNSARIDVAAVSYGVSDLQSAFSIAGAPTLVAALWTIDSASARDLVTLFFREWKAMKEKSASRALASAIRQYRAKADRAHQHPRFWAPFVVYGYGNYLPAPISGPISTDIETKIFEGVGEFFDLKSTKQQLIYSEMGDWNGRKMAGIVGSLSGKWRMASYEFGAGEIVLSDSSAYLMGYVTSEESYPVVVRYDLDGKLIWKRELKDLKGTHLVGGAMVGSHLVAIADSRAALQGWRRTLLIRFDEAGRELSRANLSAETATLLIGKSGYIAAAGTTLATALNVLEDSKLDPTKAGVLGIPPVCPGKLRTQLRFWNSQTLETASQHYIEDFQAHWIGVLDQSVVLAGSSRERCSLQPTATIYVARADGHLKELWRDRDPFPSIARAVAPTPAGLRVLVTRERPVGVRKKSVAQTTDYSKRWGDNDYELSEFSVLTVDNAGHSRVNYNSSFGISSFVRGMIEQNGKSVIFGSLGGRPAILRQGQLR